MSTVTDAVMDGDARFNLGGYSLVSFAGGVTAWISEIPYGPILSFLSIAGPFILGMMKIRNDKIKESFWQELADERKARIELASEVAHLESELGGKH